MAAYKNSHWQVKGSWDTAMGNVAGADWLATRTKRCIDVVVQASYTHTPLPRRWGRPNSSRQSCL